ncbi:MAG TPA: hypothetical protein VGD66_11135 [Allosphingosinicella sp.]
MAANLDRIVVLVSTPNRIVARAALECVAPGAANQRVISAVADESVVAIETEQNVRARAPTDRVARSKIVDQGKRHGVVFEQSKIFSYRSSVTVCPYYGTAGLDEDL